MIKKNKKCLCCNVAYSYCPNCNRKDPSWMTEFHDENCKLIFDICTRYNMQLMTKEEAQKALSACDLSKKESFKDYIQRDLANIFAEDPKPAATKAAPKSHEVVKQENK